MLQALILVQNGKVIWLRPHIERKTPKNHRRHKLLRAIARFCQMLMHPNVLFFPSSSSPSETNLHQIEFSCVCVCCRALVLFLALQNANIFSIACSMCSMCTVEELTLFV